MYKSLLVEYGHDLTLEYRLRDYPVVRRWAERVILAQQQYSIDDPARFYGFGTIEEQTDWINRLNLQVQEIPDA